MFALLIKCVKAGYASACRHERRLDAPLNAPSAPPASAIRLEAALLHSRDDVATALLDLPAGLSLTLTCDERSREVVTAEPIRAGHKLAVRALGAGRRIRKYGEFIGRMTSDVAPGAWVHSHNLVTSAVRTVADERAWRAQALPAGGVRGLGETRHRFGACPAYDPERRLLYWIDAGVPALHFFDVARDTGASSPLPRAARGLVLARDGAAIVATDDGFLRVDPSSRAPSTIAAWVPPAPPLRVTDLQCDPRGRMWCVAAVPDSGAADGVLCRYGGKDAGMTAVDRLLAPAGLAWSLDGATLYVGESGRATVNAYEFDAATGTLGAPRAFADLGTMPGELGGMAVDVDDQLWAALPGAGCLVRFTREGGVDRVVRVPASRPTACAFGGDAFRRLCVTTESAGLRDAQRRAESLSGQVLEMDVGVAGAPPHRARVE